MKKAIFFVYFICLVVSGLSAQNWDINTLHRVNSWDGKFVRNYNKIISRSEPYVAVGVPVSQLPVLHPLPESSARLLSVFRWRWRLPLG